MSGDDGDEGSLAKAPNPPKGPSHKRGRGWSFFEDCSLRGNICQVPGCHRSLHKMRPYYKRYKICPAHLEAPSLVVDGQEIRFCQQCGHFQLLEDFNGSRRSCRSKLSKHNARRRKAKAEAAAAELEQARWAPREGDWDARDTDTLPAAASAAARRATAAPTPAPNTPAPASGVPIPAVVGGMAWATSPQRLPSMVSTATAPASQGPPVTARLGGLALEPLLPTETSEEIASAPMRPVAVRRALDVAPDAAVRLPAAASHGNPALTPPRPRELDPLARALGAPSATRASSPLASTALGGLLLHCVPRPAFPAICGQPDTPSRASARGPVAAALLDPSGGPAAASPPLAEPALDVRPACAASSSSLSATQPLRAASTASSRKCPLVLPSAAPAPASTADPLGAARIPAHYSHATLPAAPRRGAPAPPLLSLARARPPPATGIEHVPASPETVAPGLLPLLALLSRAA